MQRPLPEVTVDFNHEILVHVQDIIILTTQIFDRASNSELTWNPPMFLSISKPADLARSTLASKPTATIT